MCNYRFLLCFFIIQGVKNRAISYEESIKQAYSNIKSAEKRRSDLIPNLVECVRAYSEYEYRTTLAIVEARYGNVNIDSIARSGDGDLISREVKDKISIVVEHYPNLKAQIASQLFRKAHHCLFGCLAQGSSGIP